MRNSLAQQEAARVNRTHTSFFYSSNPTTESIGEDVVDEYRCVAAPRSDRATLTIQKDQAMILDTGSSRMPWTVVFHPDGKHLLGGTAHNGVLRWQLADGREVGSQIDSIHENVRSISVSKDCRWIVCGTDEGASVWDEEMHKMHINVEGSGRVVAVDVSPDSTRFATGTDNAASIWSITNGTRLVGPLEHDNSVNGIRFSPTGERVATAYGKKAIQIFDSHTGYKLATIDMETPGWVGVTPLAWSSDGQLIFAASRDNKVRSFNVSTQSQLAESRCLHDGKNDVRSIALSANNKFIATVTPWSIWFLDASTLRQIGPDIAIQSNPEQIWSIAISLGSSYLATGQENGKIIIRDLSKLLPDLYGPFHASSHNPGMLLSPSHNVDKLHA